MVISCWKGYMKRKLGCHSVCKTYKKQRKALDEYNNNIRKIKEIDLMFNEARINCIGKVARDRRRLYNQGRPIKKGI